MKTYYLKVLHAGMSHVCASVAAVKFEIISGVYHFYEMKYPGRTEYEAGKKFIKSNVHTLLT
jgi:uncharacterized protein YsxB (DUF464 family)